MICTEYGAFLEESEDFRFPFGDDVKCHDCGVWLETEMEEDCEGNCSGWVTGPSGNQDH